MGGGVADGGGLTRITGAKEGSLCSQPSRGTALLPPSLNSTQPPSPSLSLLGREEGEEDVVEAEEEAEEGGKSACLSSIHSLPFPSFPFPPSPSLSLWSLRSRHRPRSTNERGFKTTTTDDAAAAVTLAAAAAESQSSVAPAQRGGNRRNGARTTALAPRRRRRQSGRVAEATRIDGVSEAIRE